jgi:hypothetical protein
VPKITVYQIKLYDATADVRRISRRMATPEGAAIMRGDITNATVLEIDEALFEPGEQWTPRDFNP